MIESKLVLGASKSTKDGMIGGIAIRPRCGRTGTRDFGYNLGYITGVPKFGANSLSLRLPHPATHEVVIGLKRGS
jgi:hypothetical protein